jgi:hypothetical protein
MAFISGCPKCQKPVLVPEGHSHDAVVQCPACFAEYSLGDILASIPALIVVRSGEMEAPAARASAASAGFDELDEPLLAAAPAMAGSISAAPHVGQIPHESDALDFVDEAAAVPASNGHDIAFAADGDHAADELFASAFAENEWPSTELPTDELLAPVEGNGQQGPADAGDNGDGWGGFGAESSGEETVHAALAEDTIDLAAHDSGDDEGVAHLDFAAITGKSPPGTAATGDAAVTVESPKKKRRKREANPLGRFIGMAISALLAVACVFGLAMWLGIPLPFLPKWMQFNRHPNQSAAPAPNSQPEPSKAEAPPGNVNAPPTNTSPSGTGAGKPDGTAIAATTKAPSTAPGAQGGAKPQAPANDEAATPTDPITTGPEAENQPLLPSGRSNLGGPAAVAPVNDKPKAESPSKPQAAAPAAPNKPAEIDPLANPTGSAAKPPATDPKMEKPKNDGPAAIKPETIDPFSNAPDAPAKPQAVAPKIEKPKAETPPAIKSVPPVKPELPSKPENSNPFSNPPESAAKSPAAAPKIEKRSAEKPVIEPKPETFPEMTPQPPVKPELPAKPEAADPFSNPPEIDAKPPAAAPKGEKPKVEPTPELPAPARPETAPKFEPPVAPGAVKPAPAKPEPVKPDLPKTEPVKPVLPKPELNKPEPKPEVKAATVGPGGAPVIPAAQLDSALARIAAAAQPAYGDLCQFAETATFVQGASAAQKQALRDAVKKLAGDPQMVARLAADAKKQIEDKATKGGIALSGKVSKVASKNGLFGTAIRIDGMPNAVMVFSAHPLDVKEGDTVLVLGALVSEPAKNLPGYAGKLPVVVWADVAQATP